MADAEPTREVDPRIVLIETSGTVPGVFPVTAWRALDDVEVVVAADPEAHPSVPHLAMGGIEVEVLPEGEVAMQGMDLLSGGGASPRKRRQAAGLVELAIERGSVAILLEPGDTSLGTVIGMEAARVGGLEVEFAFLVGVPPGLEVLRLAQIMSRLRDPDGGCPWDLEQDHRSLTGYLVEEAYELLDAIEREDDRDIAEELGDVLLQVVFHAQVAQDRGAFDLDQVATGISDKLVRRHPHVFGDGDASTPQEVQDNWDQLKAAEKDGRSSPFDGVPRALPALQLAEAYQRKAAKQGFDWAGPEGPIARIRQELDELAAATTDQERREELGDLLGAVVGLARTHGVDAEDAMRAAATKFRDRFEFLVGRADRQGVDTSTLDEAGWLELWEQAKGFV